MTNEQEEPICPICGNTCTYDEVDIGVGVQRGNMRCELCGWLQDQETNSYFDLDESILDYP